MALNIVASVSQNPATINESIDLEITVDDSVDNNIFDFDVLNKDFRVLGTSVSSQTRMINFKTTRQTRFTTRLIPKRTGQITIPSFSYNGATSNPIQLKVVDSQSANSKQQDRDIFIETQLSANEVWLQQQVIYTTKLYLSVQMTSGSLTQPEIAGAIVEQQGDDKESDTLIDGIRYRVIERNYLITPQRSGTYNIDSPVFQGEILDRRRSQFFNQTKVITRTGESITLNVKAIPNDYQGHWLPSELVMLNDELQPRQDEYQVGEPITRVITLSALDVSAEQLPKIDVNYPDSIKVYPDQADTHSSQRNGQIISQRIETAALVPTRSGTFTLPEIKISWWNTKRNKQEFAIIEAREIIVQPAAQSTSNMLSPPTLSDNSQPSRLNEPPCRCEEQSDNDTDSVQQQPSISSSPWAFNYLSAVITLLWLLSIAFILLLKRNKKTHIEQHTKAESNQSEKQAWVTLTKSIKENNPQGIRSNLPKWVKALTNSESDYTLPQALKRLSCEAIDQEIYRMESSIYGKQPQNWQANELQKALKQARDKYLISHAKQSGKLASLNP
ncbi:BatD family protein [Catenovulum sediminis]|uniref:BatD family protein n=1 Tax=Catenovulum sediminis TaxID=1740262 RepID=A0ABV1RND5_9ALTE